MFYWKKKLSRTRNDSPPQKADGIKLSSCNNGGTYNYQSW